MGEEEGASVASGGGRIAPMTGMALPPILFLQEVDCNGWFFRILIAGSGMLAV